jgi:vacuolar-type H+-ATPase subunit F/Vma7
VPAENEAIAVVEAACSEASLVLLGTDVASRIPQQQLDELLSRVEPAVIVVPDIRGQVPLPDMALRLRKQLGVLE